VVPRAGFLVLLTVGAALAPAGPAVAAVPSAGCGLPPAPPPGSFEVADTPREAIVVLPEDYRNDRPHPLIVAFHGRTNDNARARRYMGLEAAASRPAIFVYPTALPDETGRFTWADPRDPADRLRDYALFDHIVDRLAAGWCVDLDAVFVVGHSLGATFANSLACARAARIRALASVAGGIMRSKCTGEVAALLLHNPSDEAVPVSEGRRARDVLLRDEEAFSQPEDRRFDGFACRQYAEGQNPLLWCLHEEDVTPWGTVYPHQWPEGAAEAIMRFFETLDGADGSGS
jgi:polyhydroxybutyrate depolymerase